MSPKSLAKSLLIQTGVVALLVVGYLAWDSDAIYEWLSGDIEFTAPTQPCDLHKEACNATLDGTPVTFSITPRPVPVMQKLHFSVTAPGLPGSELKVELYGLNMNMGRYSYTLERQSDGIYRGEGMIPSCVGAMQWRANLISESATRRVGTYFTFMTE